MTSNARQGFVTSFVLLTTAFLMAFVGAARGQVCENLDLTSIYTETSQPYSFVAIHLEHYDDPSRHANPFNALVVLVGKADELKIPLTIMFHQSWIDWLENGGSSNASTVRGWFDPNRTAGPPVHEPGIHNHGPAHQAQPQSGYTEWPAVSSRAQDLNTVFNAVFYDYANNTLGTIRTVESNIEAFLNVGGGTVDIVSGTVMVPWHEAPETYAVSQRRNEVNSGRNHRIPNVTAFTGNGPHDQYLLIGEAFPVGKCAKVEAKINSLWNSDFAGLEPENIYGLAFHARDYNPRNRDNINLWLETLSGFDADNSAGKRKTMSAIMNDVVFPTDYWYVGFCGDSFCDALEACGASGMGGSCTLQQIGSANPYDDNLDGTFTNWGPATHTCTLDCGLTDMIGDNLNASGTGRGSTLRHAGRAYQAEGRFAIQHGSITTPSGAQGGAAVRLDSQPGNEVVEYDLKDEDFMDINDQTKPNFFELTHWEVRIRSSKFSESGPRPEVTISTRESDAGAWTVTCSDVLLSADTNWQESAGCPVSWAASAANRQLQIAREIGAAHIDALLLRPDPQCPPPQTGC